MRFISLFSGIEAASVGPINRNEALPECGLFCEAAEMEYAA